MDRLASPSAFACLIALTLAAAGCGDDTSTGAGGGGAGGSDATGGHDTNEGVVYEGGATHEALEELLASPPVDDVTQAAAFEEPADGAALDPAAPLTFAWSAGAVPRHGDPVNGPAYLLVFAAEGAPEVLRVFTTAETYTPDASAWQAVTGAGGPVTVTITTAIFEQNRIAQGGGPWVGPSITLGG